MKTKQLALLAFCLAGFMHGSLARADGLAISPLRVALSPQIRTAGFTLISQEPRPTLIQVHLLAWSQRNGADQLTPTDDLLVGPPIFTLQPGQTQLIRVGLRTMVTPARETTYRIVIAEVPVQPRSTDGINFAFRLSMPIFVTTDKLSDLKLKWSAVRIDAAHLRLTLEDAGDRHVQVRSLRILSTPQEVVIGSIPASYVLGGQTRSWTVHLEKPNGGPSIRIAGSTDQGPIEQAIDVRAP